MGLPATKRTNLHEKYDNPPWQRDQAEQAKKRLRNLIEEGLASGPSRRRTEADEKELLAIAGGEID